MRWNLDNIYPSFSSESFLIDLKRLEEETQALLRWQKENLISQENVEEKISYCVNKFNELSLLASKLMNYASLKLSENTNNEEALKYLNVIRQKFVDLSVARVVFTRYLKDVSLESLSNPVIIAHKYALSELKERAKYLLSDGEERLLSLVRITGGEAWNQLFSKLTSNLMCEVEIEGEKKTLPLMVVRNLAYDPRKEVRKAAYQAELKACETIAETIAFSLNSIKGEFLTEMRLRGFDSPIEPMLLENRISSKTFETMMKSIEDFLPTIRQYLKLKAKLLGYENALPWYELFAPIGAFTKKWSFDEARKLIVEKLSNFSQELGKFIDSAFEKNWIDAEPRKGKRGGAFCSSVKALKESRILMTFEGHLDNVLTLAHELGHAFHNECLKDETPMNSITPMVLAETASIFNETLVMEYLKSEDLTREEKLSLVDKELSDAVQLIIDIYSRYLFEKSVFEKRKEGPLSSKEISDMMIEAQKKAYGDGLDHNYLHPYAWIVKPHYYFPTLHFYNFPYTFGYLFGLGVFEVAKERGNFYKDYKKLLASTGRGKTEDVAKSVGIDVTSEEFWRKSLRKISESLEVLESLVQQV